MKRLITTSLGIPFASKTEGGNAIHTSLFDNYPDSVSIPLQGNARGMHLLLTGSTNHMQCHMEIARITVRESFLYGGGECEQFYGWGSEDWNRYEKWKRLGLRMFRERGPLCHLHHSRNINGKNSSLIQRRRCRTILNETLYSLPFKKINHKTDANLEIDPISGSWLHSSLDGHQYDPGLADGIIEILNKLNVKTAVDLGCGPGWYVEDLIQFGIKTFGLDGNPNVLLQSSEYPCAKMNCSVCDLSIPITDLPKAEAVLCIEVCEHIPFEKESILIENILYFESRVIIISWASVGQKGDGHVNCKDGKEVICLLESYNYKLNREMTSILRNKSELWWIKNNVLVFVK